MPPKKKPGDGLTSDAASLYEQCLARHPETLRQKDLEDMMSGKTTKEIGDLINTLLAKRLLEVMMLNGELMYKAQRKDDARKMSGLEGDEQIVYGIIKAAGTEGIWTKFIKAKSNLHQTVMTRCLKSLESSQLIKAVKSVKTPTRKIYMLFDLQPSIEVTGGPWFTDQELDVEFIERLCTAIYRFIESRSFPPRSVGIGKLYPADHSGFPNVSEITNWLRNSELTDVDLGISEVGNILDVLICDGKIEQQPDGTTYRAIRQVHLSKLDGFTEAPCGRCPVFMLCEEDSPVNASGCPYFNEWLEQVV